MSDLPRGRPPERGTGRGLLAASVTLSAMAVGCLVWWLVDDARSWWALGAGVAAAAAGVVLGARGRRAVPGSGDKRGGR